MMPFQSERQRKFLWWKYPEIAKRWTKKYGAKIVAKAIKYKRKKR